MIKKEKPWFLCFDRWALVLFALGVLTINGKNQLRILGIVLALAFIYKYFVSNQRWKGLDHPPEVLAYTMWGIWTGLTGLIVCTSYEFFWMNYRILLQMIVMIWCVYGLLRLNMSARIVYWTIIVGCIIQVIALKLGYSFEKDVGIVFGEQELGEERVSGLTGNANSLGFVMVTGVMSVFQLWRMKPSIGSIFIKMFLFVFIMIATYVTWQTGSRKTSVAVAVLLVGWSGWVIPQGKGLGSFVTRVVLLFLLLVIGGSLLTFILDETVVGARFNELLERGKGSVVAGVEDDIRSDMYRAGLQMFFAHPVAGVGLGHFQLYYWRGAYSHSDYIEPLACTGLIGFLLYQGFNVFLVMRVLRLYKAVCDKDEKYRLTAMLLSLAVQMLLGFGAPYWSSQRSFILLSVFVAYTWMLEKRLKVGSEPKKMFWKVTDMKHRQ